jgi:hypothetical protein
MQHCRMASLLLALRILHNALGGGGEWKKKFDLQPSTTCRRHCSYLDVQSESIRDRAKWIQLADDII